MLVANSIHHNLTASNAVRINDSIWAGSPVFTTAVSGDQYPRCTRSACESREIKMIGDVICSKVTQKESRLSPPN